MRIAPPIQLKPEEREELKRTARARSLPSRQVERARIVLLASEGKQDIEIAAELSISVQKAARWRRRYLEAGWAGMEKDAPRPGRTPTLTPAKVREVIQK